MKPGLIYAALIAITVTGVSLFLRLNISVPENTGMPAEAADNAAITQKAPASKQVATDDIAGSGVSTTETSNSNDGEE